MLHAEIELVRGACEKMQAMFGASLEFVSTVVISKPLWRLLPILER